MKTKQGFLIASLALLLLGAGCAGSRTIAPATGEPEGDTKVNEVADTREWPAKGEPIKIGWVGPLTGDLAAPGIDSRIATEMAIEEVNAAGGINGYPIQLVIEDGKCNPKDASAAGTKLITIDRVVAIDGGLCSGETTAIAPIAESNRVPLLSGCSSAPALTDAGDYIFRSYPSDSFQGSYGAEFIYNELGKKKVAIIAVQSDWGLGIKKTFTDRFRELGGEVLISEDVADAERDLRSILTKIKASDAEAIYFPGQTELTIAGLRQMSEMGITLPVLGGDTGDDSVVHQSGVAEGYMYTVPAQIVTEEWVKKLEAKGGNSTVCAPRSYDNIKIFADVIGRVGIDGEAIKNALYKVKDFPGINGPVTFDENGDPIGAAYQVKIVKNKKAEPLK